MGSVDAACTVSIIVNIPCSTWRPVVNPHPLHGHTMCMYMSQQTITLMYFVNRATLCTHVVQSLPALVGTRLPLGHTCIIFTERLPEAHRRVEQTCTNQHTKPGRGPEARVRPSHYHTPAATIAGLTLYDLLQRSITAVPPAREPIPEGHPPQNLGRQRQGGGISAARRLQQAG